MSTIIAKIFVLSLAITYGILLVALIAWSVRTRSGPGKARHKSQPHVPESRQ